MVLLLPNGTAIGSSSADSDNRQPAFSADAVIEALLGDPDLSAACRAFLAHPEASVAATTPSVCVMQRETASVNYGSEPPDLVVGSQDATTCVIVVLRCPETRSAWVAHYDDVSCLQDTDSMLEAVAAMAAPEVYLVGGFEEPRGYSRATCEALLHALCACGARVRVRLACILSANILPPTMPQHHHEQEQQQGHGGPAPVFPSSHSHPPQPQQHRQLLPGAGRASPAPPQAGRRTIACRQLALRCSDGAALPHTFEDRGPDLPRRFAAALYLAHHDRNTPVYSTAPTAASVGARGRFQVPAVDASALSSWTVLSLERKARMRDVDVLRDSTSPWDEGPNFVGDVRATAAWLVGAQGRGRLPAAAYEWVRPDEEGRRRRLAGGEGHGGGAAAEPVDVQGGGGGEEAGGGGDRGGACDGLGWREVRVVAAGVQGGDDGSSQGEGEDEGGSSQDEDLELLGTDARGHTRGRTRSPAAAAVGVR